MRKLAPRTLKPAPTDHPNHWVFTSSFRSRQSWHSPGDKNNSSLTLCREAKRADVSLLSALSAAFRHCFRYPPPIEDDFTSLEAVLKPPSIGIDATCGGSDHWVLRQGRDGAIGGLMHSR